MTQLQKLDLRGCELITDKGLYHLSKLAELEVLYLGNGNRISDVGLSHLRKLVKLEELHLNWCEEITDTGLAFLTCLIKLQKLDLIGCKRITDKGLSYLSSLPNLRILNLEFCNLITYDGLIQITHIQFFWKPVGKDLQSFPLSGITEEAYANVKPHLDAMYYACKDVGKEIRDLFKLMLRVFGTEIRPYALRFAKEKKLSFNLEATNN